MENAYRNVGFYLVALPLILIAGFWMPYIAGIPKFDPSITAAVHIHALLLFAWVAMLVLQPMTIRARAFTLHRRLGKISFVLMPLIWIFAIAMLHKEYHEHLASGMTAIKALTAEYLSSTQLALVAAFYCLAIMCIKRRSVSNHIRYMICVAIALAPAGVARTLGYWFDVSQSKSQLICLTLIDVSLVALMLVDRRRGVSPRPYVVALAAYVLVEAGWFTLGRPV